MNISSVSSTNGGGLTTQRIRIEDVPKKKVSFAQTTDTSSSRTTPSESTRVVTPPPEASMASEDGDECADTEEEDLSQVTPHILVSNTTRGRTGTTSLKHRDSLFLHRTSHPTTGISTTTRSSIGPPTGGSTNHKKKTQLTADDSSQYICLLEESVHRLRVQRSQVEQLQTHHEYLQQELLKKQQENERLRREVSALSGVEKKNAALITSLKLVEARVSHFEETIQEQKQLSSKATQQVIDIQKENEKLKLQKKDLVLTHESKFKQVSNEKDELIEQIHKLEHLLQKETKKNSKLQEIDKYMEENTILHTKITILEKQIDHLLATTSRQTSMLAECDQVLIATEKKTSEMITKTFDEQLCLKQNFEKEIEILKKKISFLENENTQKTQTNQILQTKIDKKQKRIELLQLALSEKEKSLETLQQEFVTRDRVRFHADEKIKVLKKKEKLLSSKVSELQLALSDMTTEKNILQDQFTNLQDQLEMERKDRSKWASARLQLLAQFCDEGTKLSTTLSKVNLITDDSNKIKDRSFRLHGSQFNLRKRKDHEDHEDDQDLDDDCTEDDVYTLLERDEILQMTPPRKSSLQRLPSPFHSVYG